MAGRDDISLSSTASTAFTRDFIDQQGSTFHPALGMNSSFNMEASQYEPTEVFDLEETLRQYKDNVMEKDDIDFDLLKCTWDDVLHEQERAKLAVSESENRGKKLHRRIWRGVGTFGPLFTPGLAAIPDNLSPLNGGLAVIFSLARHRAQNRQKILNAFDDIPNVIMMARGKAESIPRDQKGAKELHKEILELQRTLLRFIPALILKLNPGTILDKIKNPFKLFDVDDLFKEVHRSGERVRLCAEGIMDNIIVNTNEIAHKDYRMSIDIHTTTKQTGIDVNKIYKTTQETGVEVKELRDKIEEMMEHQRSFQSVIDGVSSKNSLLAFLMEYLKQSGQREDDQLSKKSPPPDYEPATPVTPRNLLRLMDVHHLKAIDEEQHIIRRSHTLSKDAISHAATMFQTSQVRGLLHSPESGVVLVNGCSDKSQNTRISPITHVCATLTHALRRSAGSNVVLVFFCGQHSGARDNLEGPQGLMRSMVAHLVLSMVQNKHVSESDPIWFPGYQGNFEELSFVDICKLFYHLFELLPKGITVYCVVDGISYYERPGWMEEYDIMMECFSSIIANQTALATFKLLITSPTISRGLPNLLPHQKVSLRNARSRGSSNPEAYLRSALGNPAPQEEEWY